LTERRRGNKGKGVLKGGRDGSGLSRQNTINSNEALLSSSSAAAAAEEGRSETILMMQQQDDTLDDLNQAVVRVGHMADTIHEEIGSQNNMLKSLEEDLADAEEQLGVVMGRLAKLLKTKNKCQLGLIVVLTLVVLVLFFLVLYT
jgi:t-SNARE complex subunit (syntaxin)